jgi:hypothetical protein
MASVIRLLALGAMLLMAGCGSDASSGSSSAPGRGVVVEVDFSGQPLIYLKSDNVDPTSIGGDDANSHKIASLPDGLVEVCHYTLSQGVNWQVWSIAGSKDSLDAAHQYCAKNGQ